MFSIIFSVIVIPILCQSQSALSENNHQRKFTLPLSYKWGGYYTNIAIGNISNSFKIAIESRDQVFIFHDPLAPSKSYTIDDRHITTCDGSSGVTGSDTIFIGNTSLENIPFGLITKVHTFIFAVMSSKFVHLSGYLGLGFRQKRHFESLFNNLFQNQDAKVAAFFLKRINDTDDRKLFAEEAGHVTLGSENGDETLYEDEIFWIKGSEGENGDKMIVLNSISIDGESNLLVNDGTDQFAESEYFAVIDASSSKIILPEDLARKINQQTFNTSGDKKSKYYTLSHTITPCNKTNSLPNVTFDFGNFRVSIPPHDYMMPGREMTGDDGMCISLFDVEIREMKSQKVFLGLPFLYNAYTLFDYKQKRIGFAKYKPDVLKAVTSYLDPEPEVGSEFVTNADD